MDSRMQLLAIAPTTTGGVGTELLSDAVATTILGIIPILQKCELLELHVVNKGTSTHATAFVVNFRKRVTAGTATGDSSIGTITRPTPATSTQGKDFYQRPTTKITLQPGQEVVVVVDTANGNACTIQAGILVEPMPEDPGNITAQTNVTS